MKKNLENRKYNSAFTLIELLVVVAIIGILSAVVISALNSAREKGKIASVKLNLKNMISQVELTYDNSGNYSTACASVQKMIDAITSFGGVVNCYSYPNYNYPRWGASAKISSSDTKNYSVDSFGVVTWDAADVGSRTWVNAVTSCASIGGRLPSVEELYTLWLVYGTTPTGFVGNSYLYWTNTTQPTADNFAYLVNMTTGTITVGGKDSNTYMTRCVR